MKLQLQDTSEITTTLDLAPPTKKLMHWKETGGVEKLFALPGRSIASKRMSKVSIKVLYPTTYVVLWSKMLVNSNQGNRREILMQTKNSVLCRYFTKI